jgi:hypothetical protein
MTTTQVRVGQVWRDRRGDELTIDRVCLGGVQCGDRAGYIDHVHFGPFAPWNVAKLLRSCTLVRDSAPPAPEAGQTWRENATDALCEIVEVRGLSAHVRQLGRQTVVSLTFNELRANFSLYGALICRACGVPADGHGSGCACPLTRGEAERTNDAGEWAKYFAVERGADTLNVPLLPAAGPPAPAVPWRAGQRRRVTREGGIATGVIHRRDSWTAQPGDDHWLLLGTYGITYAVHERMPSVLLEDAPAPVPLDCEAPAPALPRPGETWRHRQRADVRHRVLDLTLEGNAIMVRRVGEHAVYQENLDAFVAAFEFEPAGLPVLQGNCGKPIRNSTGAVIAHCNLRLGHSTGAGGASCEWNVDRDRAVAPPVAAAPDPGDVVPVQPGPAAKEMHDEFGKRIGYRRYSDIKGKGARATLTDAESGCRLGCTCPQHRPPREPWVPSVDDFDLLPDADR